MDLVKIEQLLQLMRSYGLQEVEIKDGESSVKLVQSPLNQTSLLAPPASYPVAMPAAMSPLAPFPVSRQEDSLAAGRPLSSAANAAPMPQRKLKEVKSPFIGTFYAAPAPGSEPFVQVGQKVKKGDTLCIVEAMKLMNEIEAEEDGTIAQILIDNEGPVEYDQLLFLLE